MTTMLKEEVLSGQHEARRRGSLKASGANWVWSRQIETAGAAPCVNP
jgi:hypothetical protein